MIVSWVAKKRETTKEKKQKYFNFAFYPENKRQAMATGSAPRTEYSMYRNEVRTRSPVFRTPSPKEDNTRESVTLPVL